MSSTAHVDTFARDNLPPRDQWPEFLFDLPELQYPERLNCAVELLDKAIPNGWGSRVAILGDGVRWTYVDLLAIVNQIAHVLTGDMGLVPGNRILLRGANDPMLAAIWLAAAKAGLVSVTTMPLLRPKELSEMIDRAQISAALCEAAFAGDLITTRQDSPYLTQVVCYKTDKPDGLEALMEHKPTEFEAVDTAADDTVIVAFTSGTTGSAKGTMHFHRDILAICDCFPKSMLRMRADDICLGSPPLGFTFGLGGLLLFPMRVGAATILKPKYTPETYLETIARCKATLSWTSPFFYRKMADVASHYSIDSLRACVSAGEALPAATRSQWRDATGIEIIDGIGATEMLHIFISHTEDTARPGATGKPIPGYQAVVLDTDGKPAPPGTVGRLAVKGPTGCRYLADDRQTAYVQHGWNLTGDAYLVDEDGYFFFQARTDDIIVTTGYNVAGPEVESALLKHPAVADCAVVGAPDADRGTIIKAFVVLRDGYTGSPELTKAMQEFVKNSIAPYKYPRAIEFVADLPRTPTGKVQRFKLREQARV